ncbi:MAG TPA: cache domain-containing protein [Roseiflexaceae bacterium]|jgi:two-component system sensor histidine kinase/response regulator|nr:cache domain-containing protein [Roseiflexaceae bacterium]
MRLFHHHRFTIRLKMLLLALGLAWTPLVLIGALGMLNLDQARDTAVQTVTEALQQQAESNLEKRTIDKAQRYNAALASVEQQVRSLSATGTVLFGSTPSPELAVGRVWVSPDGLTLETGRAHATAVARAQIMIPLLRAAVQSNSLVSLGYVGLEDGGVLATDHDIVDVLQQIKPFDVRKRNWYITARSAGHTVWVDTYVDANTKKLTTTCATPIYDRQGNFVGVVGFDLLLDTIQQDLLKFSPGENGYAFLINGEGKVLVRPDMEPGEASWNSSFAGENLLQSSDPALRAVVQRMTQRQQAVEQLFYQGGNVYLAYAPIPSAGWSVGMVVPQNEVVQLANAVGTDLARRQQRLRADIILVFGVMMAGIGLGSVILTRQITHPLRQLRSSAHRITAGDLHYQVEQVSNDEIGDLAQSFNMMTASLRQKVVELEENLQHLATLNDVSNRFKAIVSLPELLDAIPRAICRDFGFDRAALYMINDNVLQVVSVCFGMDGAEQEQAFLHAANDQPITMSSNTVEADVVRSGQAVVVTNPWDNPRVLQHKQRASSSESYVQAPIFGKDGKIIGLLSADYYHQKREVTAQDAAQVLTYASMVGLSVENARLYEELERKVAQRTDELRVALERAREADRMKTRFLAAISHELRTPLNAIIGFSTVLLEEIQGPVTHAQREDLRTIHDNGQFLLHLITELLDLARIEAGKIDLRAADVDIAAVINDVAGTAQGLLRDRSVKLRVNLPANLPPVLADRGRVRQILLNLLSNAVKFTEFGEIAVSARPVMMSRNDGKDTHTLPCIAISIRDTGRGIEPDLLPVVFEEFRQVHADRTGMRGSGLGLAITRGLVEAHGGRIWVESVLGQGTIFTFTLPVSLASKPRRLVTTHARRAATNGHAVENH